MNKDLEILGKKIIDYRATHNISQVRFAELCKVSQQTICNVENGIQSPSKLTKRKILNLIEKEN